ncbi:serine protease [Luteolibacter sp. LG18]|uniref:S1C family serine protease n=1 Tax=Luteolibacter sp. LG18 TaxID=2819286 RepID=UPI002B2CFA6F|nr:hypothetical protein llg_09210 [Luteolibacter sp. LG18]
MNIRRPTCVPVLSHAFGILLAGLPTLHAAGVAVVKEQDFHRDESATPLVYLERFDSGAPFVKFRMANTTSTVDRSKLAGYVDVPSSIPPNIRTEADIQPLRQSLDQMNAFAKRFPKSEPLLKANIDLAAKHVREFDDGKVRYSGNWITKADFANIQKDLDQKAAKFKQEEDAQAEVAHKRRMEREQFERDQRSKGLEEFEGNWLPRGQVIELQRRAQATKEAVAAVESKSINNSIFSILQVTEDGCLATVRKGSVKTGGFDTTVVFIFGGAKGLTADGDTYKGNLYWCGTYSYKSVAGIERSVNAYCPTKADAVAVMKKRLGIEDVPGERSGAVAAATSSHPTVPECLRGAKASGSGFFIGNQGYFVTNAHVVENSLGVSIYHGGEKLKAEVVTIDKSADLAVLKVDQPHKGIVFAPGDADVGQDIFAIGFPQPELQGLEVKLTKGVISSRKGMADDDSKFQVDAAVQPGNSGGPLCDPSGNLVGVIVSGLNQIAVASVTGAIPQNVNYAIKCREVRRLLSSKNIDFSTPANGASSLKAATDTCGIVIVR